MAAIMCTQPLQQALLTGGLACATAPGPQSVARDRLGNWAATIAGNDIPIAVAQNERTCLTLIFPLPAAVAFRGVLADRLRQALREYGVTPEMIAAECEAISAAAFVRLRNPALVAALELAAFEATAHADDTTALRHVQDVLNTSGIDCVPRDEVRTLFGAQRRREKSAPAGRR